MDASDEYAATIEQLIADLKKRVDALENRPAPTSEVTKAQFDAAVKAVQDRATALESRAEAVFVEKPPADGDAKKGVLYFSVDEDGHLTLSLEK